MYTPEMILEAGANAGIQRQQLNFLIQQLKIRYGSNVSQNSGKPLVSGWRDFRGQKPNNGDKVLIKDPSLVQGDRWVTEWDDESIGFYLTYELLWMPLPA